MTKGELKKVIIEGISNKKTQYGDYIEIDYLKISKLNKETKCIGQIIIGFEYIDYGYNVVSCIKDLVDEVLEELGYDYYGLFLDM